MTISRYLPLLILIWAVNAVADDVRPYSLQTSVDREIAQIVARPSLGLDDLFRIAELANPELAVARTDVLIRTGRMSQAGLYPNPELSFAMEEVSVDDPAFNKRKVELSQAILIGGRRGAAVDAARAEVDRVLETEQEARREIYGRIHAWWANQLHYREAEAEITDLAVEAERTLDMARTRFEARAAPEAHVTRALLELYDVETARQDLERRRVRSAAEAGVVFGGVDVPPERIRGSLDSALGAGDPLPDDATGGTDHPSLRAARRGVEAAEARLETARKERIPDLNLFVAYGRSGPDAEHFWEGGVSLPLPLFHRNQGRVAETASLVIRARIEERLAVDGLAAALTSARADHRTLRTQLDRLAGDIEPAAERALTQARVAYRSGRLAFLELVDAQRTFMDVRLRILALRLDLALAEADLMGLLGAGPYALEGEER
ncbi:MAG: TolC family protein [bacterium]|nr:TolC family protein [bacterium]